MLARSIACGRDHRGTGGGESDQVVIRLESPGGWCTATVWPPQLQRLRDKQIPLTVVVDKVAPAAAI